jgi:hypothetical protein
MGLPIPWRMREFMVSLDDRADPAQHMFSRSRRWPESLEQVVMTRFFDRFTGNLPFPL